MTDCEEQVLARLAGRYLLFVEDTRFTIENYIGTLCKIGVKENQVLPVSDLQSALDILQEKSPENFALVLVDLNVPPIPQALEQFRDALIAGHLNQGQTLGLWLSLNHPSVPYAYMTAYPVALEERADKDFKTEILKNGGALQSDVSMLVKYEVMPSGFLQRLCDIWEDWAEWQQKRQAAQNNA